MSTYEDRQVARLDRLKDNRRALVARLRDEAQNVIATAMREKLDPTEREIMGLELCTASATVACQAAGIFETSSHLSKLSGDVCAAGDLIAMRRRG